MCTLVSERGHIPVKASLIDASNTLCVVYLLSRAVLLTFDPCQGLRSSFCHDMLSYCFDMFI